MNVFEKFTDHSKKALETAYYLAVQNKKSSITAEHILQAIANEKGSIGYEILLRIHFPSAAFVKKTPKSGAAQKLKKISFSPEAIRIIEKAAVLANAHMHPYIGTEHLLYGVLSQNNETIAHIFNTKKINVKEIKNRLQLIFKSTSKFPQISNLINNAQPSRMDEFGFLDQVMDTQKKSILEFYAINLSDPKNQKNIDPVIGRENELERIIQILSRRTKNNPLLLGDPGVGKTAIIEGLAKKILLGDVPHILLRKKIFMLDLGLLVAGSSFRGEFEQRLKQILAEIKRDPDIILFIDEIHNIVGAGSAMGAMDAANILKPSLARGEIRCIGATTTEEFKKHIENDAAFERRFQVIHVAEPSIEKSIEILHGIKGNYEKFHGVAITDTAIRAAVNLSERYIQEKFLPDKAIDLIDEAASAIKIKKQANALEQDYARLEKEFNAVLEQKKQAVMREEYEKAIGLREQEDELVLKISAIKNKLGTENEKITGEITENDIKKIISKITRLSTDELDIEGRSRLITLEKKLSEKIIGQGIAIQTLTKHLKKAWVGISDARRPMGSFMFLGPSGVGKTELAKTLAQALFHDAQALVRIDMSEYGESFNVSKLIGSPAGYIGYKDMNNLCDRVKKHPHSLVLFDEIEKAHPQIFHLLLQILEDGHLTDAGGKKVNFKNTIIIMTSNIGSEEFKKTTSLGFTDASAKTTHLVSFEDAKKNVLEKLSKFFKVEFLNRIDKTIVFEPLGADSIETIVKMQLQELGNKLAEKNITLTHNASVIKFLAKLSYSPHTGARAIRKNISEYIENSVAEKLMSEDAPIEVLHISEKNGKIILV